MTHTATTSYIVEASGLERVFELPQGNVTAVAGLDLVVRPGEIVGLLGPNGAGKTTTLRMLTTLLTPTAGEATVAGSDLRQEPAGIRGHIGYVAQGGSTDPQLSGREELLQQCRLYGMDLQTAQDRAEEVCEQLDVDEFVDRPLATLSGGQRRRIEIALGIVHRPQLIFLDEPTLGLDPQNRATIWKHVRQIRDVYGTTVVLSTNYLDEAEALCDRLFIIDRGRLVADGTPSELKRRVTGDIVTIEAHEVQLAHDVLFGLIDDRSAIREIVAVDDETVRLGVEDGDGAIAMLLGALAAADVHVKAVRLQRPTLDDVFFSVTGRSVSGGTPPDHTVQAAGLADTHAQ